MKFKIFTLNILACAILYASDITFIQRPFENATMSWDDFFDRVGEKALNNDFVLFRGRKMITHHAFHQMQPQQQKNLSKEGALVLINGKIERYIRFSEMGGVSIATNQNAFVTFDIRYLETLRHVGIGSDFYAMCVLPRYNKCLLLRYLAFDPSLPPKERTGEHIEELNKNLPPSKKPRSILDLKTRKYLIPPIKQPTIKNE